MNSEALVLVKSRVARAAYVTSRCLVRRTVAIVDRLTPMSGCSDTRHRPRSEAQNVSDPRYPFRQSRFKDDLIFSERLSEPSFSRSSEEIGNYDLG
jgi:hypothetical protein